MWMHESWIFLDFWMIVIDININNELNWKSVSFIYHGVCQLYRIIVSIRSSSHSTLEVKSWHLDGDRSWELTVDNAEAAEIKATNTQATFILLIANRNRNGLCQYVCLLFLCIASTHCDWLIRFCRFHVDETSFRNTTAGNQVTQPHSAAPHAKIAIVCRYWFSRQRGNRIHEKNQKWWVYLINFLFFYTFPWLYNMNIPRCEEYHWIAVPRVLALVSHISPIMDQDFYWSMSLRA